MVDIDKTYDQVKSYLKEAEEKRKAAFKSYKNLRKIIFGLLITGAIVLFIFIPESWMAGLMIIFLGFVPVVFKKNKEENKLTKYFKKTVLPTLANNMGEGVSYSATEKIDEKLLIKSGLFGRFNRYSSDDLITVETDDKKYRFAEISLNKRISRTGETNKTEHVFTGIFFDIQLSRKVPVSFYVYPYAIVWFSDKVANNLIGQSVKFDHEAFNKLYGIRSEEPETVKKFLNHTMLDKLVEINDTIKNLGLGKNPETIFSFVEDHIFIAIRTQKGIMNPTLSQPLDTKEFIGKEIKVLNKFTEIVDNL